MDTGDYLKDYQDERIEYWPTLPHLVGDPLGVGLPQTTPLLAVLQVAGEVPQGSVLHGKHEVSLTLEHTVKHPEDVGVVAQLNTAVVLSGELLCRHLVPIHSLEDDLLPGEPVLCQPDPAVPALTIITVTTRALHVSIITLEAALVRSLRECQPETQI